MFGFLCKNVRWGGGVRTSPPVFELHFSHNPSIFWVSSVRYISSNENSAIERSFTVSYLINSCGLSPQSAFTASKHVHFRTVTNPDSVCSLLNNKGFSETQISKLVKRYPKVLMCNPQKTILPKVEFLHSKGFSSSDIANIFLNTPHILHTSLKDRIVPSYNMLHSFFQCDDKTVAAINRNNFLLIISFAKSLANKMTFLQDKKVSKSNIVKLLHCCPRIFTMNFGKFKRIVEEAEDMGFDPSRGTFFAAVQCLKSMSKFTWEKKVGVYKRWNLSESEILAAFRIQPAFMAASEDKITAMMDLFVNKLGWDCSSIGKCLFLMSYSLEKRLIPRALVLQFLVSRGLIKKNYRSTRIFMCPETTFLKNHVNCYDEAPELLKIYNEKLALSSSQGSSKNEVLAWF